MGVLVSGNDILTELDLKSVHNEHNGDNALSEKDFSGPSRVREVHRFQRFTTLSLLLDGQDFHLGQLQSMVPSGRGLILATLRRGEMTLRSKAVSEAIKPADFAIIPLGADATLFGKDCELDCLIIDEQLKPLLPKGLDEANPVVLSALLPATSLLYQQFICFRAYTNMMQEEDVEELLPPLLMMLNTIFKRYGGSKAPAGTSLLDKVCAHIKTHLLDPDLNPDTVADQMGLSRAKLYRLAEPLGGIKKYIRSERLQLAYEKLQKGGDDSRSISNLAFDLGFGTETAFRRSFKDAFGMTPSELRQQQKDTI